MRKLAAVLATLALTLTLLISTGTGSAQAAPSGPSPSTYPMRYEKFNVKGNIGTKVVRPVKLQAWSGGKWRTVASAKTLKTGRYTFTISTGRSSLKVRVYAKKIRVNKHTYRKTISRTRTIGTQGQSTLLSMSKILIPGQTFSATATSTPSRIRRSVQLQALRGTSWVAVTTKRQDDSGDTYFTVIHDAANQGYRAVALPFNGAPASASAWTKITNFTNDHAKATQVSAGTHGSCALTDAGSVRCWGDNYRGQLGDGTVHTESFSSLPSTVVGLPSKMVSITSGDEHNCAIAENHTAWCWGNNHSGQLGDGTTTDRGKPVQVKGLTNVISIAAGSVETCAVVGATASATSGAAKCWGYNYRGKLGDGTTTARKLPTQVHGLTSGVTAISTGSGHTCAVTSAGTAKCWGDGSSGQLGSGSTTSSKVPVAVKNLTGIATVSAGAESSCATTTTGAAWCWGTSYVNDTKWRVDTAPKAVTGLTTGVNVIAAGIDTCAVQAGAAKCWGYNESGTVGDGTDSGRANPVTASGLGSGVATITTSVERISGGAVTGHSCAVTTAGAVTCWGDNSMGELGDSGLDSTNAPVSTIGFA